MKKIIALLLAAVMVFALCACGSTAAPAADTTVAAPADKPAPAPVEAAKENRGNADIMNDPGLNELLSKLPGATVVGVRHGGSAKK